MHGSESNKIHRSFQTSFFDTKDGSYRLPVLKHGDAKIIYSDGREVEGKLDTYLKHVSNGKCTIPGVYVYIGNLN